MKNKFGYIIDSAGIVIQSGYIGNYGNYCDGSEPFIGFDIANWRKDMSTGEWVSTVVNYQYIIIPSELIPSLTESSHLVAGIDVQYQFNVILSNTPITTREGIELMVPSDVLNMTPCKILTWEVGDDALLQGIIDVWNSQEDYRIIEFSCKFDSLADLEAFKQLQK